MMKPICFFFVMFLVIKGNAGVVLEKDKIAVDRVDSLNKLAQSANETYGVEAFDYATQALILAEREQDNAGYAVALSHLGYAHIIAGNYDSAHVILNEGIERSRAGGLERVHADLIKKRAAAFFYQGHTDSALHYFQNSFLKYEELKDSVEMNKLANNLGSIAYRRGDFKLAMSYYLKCLAYDEAKADLKGMATSCNNAGLVLLDMGDYQNAMNYLNRAIRIRSDLNDSVGLASSWMNMGYAFTSDGAHEKALNAFTAGIKFLDSLQNPERYAGYLQNIGESYMNLNQDALALPFLQRALSTKELLGTKSGLVSTLASIGRICLRQGDYLKSQRYCEQSIQLAKETGELQQLVNTYETLLKAYVKLGKEDQAIEAFAAFKLYNDSIYDSNVSRQVSELQTEYETEKKEQKIATLQAETEVQKLQLSQTRMMILVVAAIGLLIALVFFFVNRRKALRQKEQRQRERFRAVMEAEESERKRMARELHDGLGQMLSTVRLYVSDVDDRQNVKIDRSLRVLDATIEEVRAISHNLMPRKLLDAGLTEALKDMAQRISESGKLQVEMKGIDRLAVDEHTAIALYRSIQEVVNNAIKYAQASQLVVDVTEAQTGWQVTVADNGQGFNTENIAKSKGIGWSNIFSRMELIGGHVQVVSKPGEGTKVHLAVPRAPTLTKATG